MAWTGQSAQHDADHCETKEGGDSSRVTLEVTDQASIATDPSKGALDDPAFWQDDEAMGIAALDDLQPPGAGTGNELGHLRSLVAGVGKDALDEREGSPGRAQQVARTVAILHVGRMDGDAQQQAQRIDEDVALATSDFLARIKTLRVDGGAPFCAALPLWLSMIAAEGLASRPARSRVST